LFEIEETSFDSWTLITAVVDREQDELRLYRNESLVGTRNISGLGAIDNSGSLSFGGRPNGSYAVVTIDSVRMYATALEEDAIRSLYEQNRVSDVDS
jgi:hypothetical protein